jgi:CBS domain-containing protein
MVVQEGTALHQEDPMKLSQLFPKKLVTAAPGEKVAEVARKMQDHNVGTVVVVKDQRPAGIVTDRDLALALGAQGISPQAPVEKVMTANVQVIGDNAGIYTVTKYIRDMEVRRLPVVDDDGRLVTVVSLDDLMRFFGRELYNLGEGIKHEMEVH